ncbi:hypothetical protein GXP67_25670 [Rhodocytophaga rosea]|uniref:T9SS type A sorting domain-containing protein n=1 Tax=Rhodocytophaga rosea TaxID=2704465 RepID=A0A6C0GP15_9BACT|nr:Ig-like domain-containing protein [Rhodocytophaga rosea]QHT69791.1 hypothetical protein GXP67_25670 [Rhodocytophaga rosea]
MTFRILRFIIGCLLVMGLSGASGTAWAQTVSSAEYFFDTDPGVGNGTSITITAGASVEINAEIDMTSLTTGTHILFVRTRDSNGRWSLMEGRTFLIQDAPVISTPTITAAEYFFDTDPGNGNGTSLSVTAGSTIDLEPEINLTGLAAGVHTLFVRTRDSNGKWSLIEGRTFLVQPTPVTVNTVPTQGEYFFDTDPGFGKGKSIAIGENGQAEVEIDLSKEGLNAGFHTLYIRVKDSRGTWSLQESRSLVINQALTSLAQITAAEYFFDNANPAPGAGKPLTITPGASLEMDSEIDITNLALGKHQLTIRVKDSKGIWSDVSVQEFTIDPNAIKVLTLAPTNVTSESITLQGTVNANGASAAVAFQYSTDLSYVTLAPATPSSVTGTADTPVSVALTGLTANTTYNYRIRVITAQDTVYSLNETFYTPLESIPPTATLSPVDDATNINIYSDLTLTFSEAIQKGTGSIIIRQNNDVYATIPLSSDLITISETDTKVTINPATDFEFSARISVEIPEGTFTDLAGNNYVGTTATTWNFTTLPPITIEKGFTEIESDASAAETAVKVNYPVAAISQVKILSKDITRNEWREYPMLQNTQDLAKFTLNLPLPATLKDEIGLEYYFELTTTAGQKVVTDVQLVNTSYNDPGLPIPGLIFGSEKKDYQIISIPLNTSLKEVSAIFNELGSYDKEKWRLFAFENSRLVEYTNGFTTIEPGKAYLLIVKDQISITTGEGSTLRQNENNPFTLNLLKGWNLIGNPYNLNLSWKEIREKSGIPENGLVGKLRVLQDGTYPDAGSDKLNAFSGGFVFCDEAVTLKFPVKRNLEYNSARIAAEESLPRYHPDSEFESNFTLHTKELSYGLGGLGMHPDAQPDRDYLDEIGLPKILHYLQVNFAHPEHFYGRFTKDMVPVEENKVWEFTVESNLDAQQASLKWENYFARAIGKQLFLYDPTAERIIDMQSQQQYTFDLSKEHKFRVYYGDARFMAENLNASRIQLLANMPNPFSESTTIAFALPKSQLPYQVQVQVFDANGKQVATLAEGKYQAGFYQLVWDGKNGQGQRLPAGMYMGRATIRDSASSQNYTLKMILR